MEGFIHCFTSNLNKKSRNLPKEQTMCLFSAQVDRVSNTKIFAARLTGGGEGEQFTVYRNDVALSNNKPVAMVLPLPNPGGYEGTIAMFDMSPYPKFFDHLESMFEKPPLMRGGFGSKGMGIVSMNSKSVLPVLECGPYKYSVASTLDDLDRVNWDAFEVAGNFKSLLEKHYAQNYGFLVCLCSKSGSYSSVGVIHPALPGGRIFIPTMHEHYGGDAGHMAADWDHSIYVMNCANAVSDGIITTSLGLPIQVTAKRPIVHPLIQLDYSKLPADLPRSLSGNALHFMAGFTVKGSLGNGDLILLDSERLVATQWTACSYALTHSEHFVHQDWYTCDTCYPTASMRDLGICSYCASVHAQKGHQVKMQKEASKTSSFCDSPHLASPAYQETEKLNASLSKSLTALVDYKQKWTLRDSCNPKGTWIFDGMSLTVESVFSAAGKYIIWQSTAEKLVYEGWCDSYGTDTRITIWHSKAGKELFVDYARRSHQNTQLWNVHDPRYIIPLVVVS